MEKEIIPNPPNEQKHPNDFKLKTKVEDMMKYGKKAVAMFPRRERQTADEIRRCMLNMYRLTIEMQKRYFKKSTIQDLDIELSVLQHLVRLASDREYYDKSVAPPLTSHKSEVWSRYLDEIGKMIGGYIKSLK